MKQIEFERWEPDAENPRKLNYAGQRAAEDVFHELEARLDSVGYLPDEYLLLDRRWQNGREMPRDAGFFCRTDYGGSEGIYLDAAYHDADTHPHIHMMVWTDQETVLKRDAVVKLRSAMTNSIFQAELENLYIRKDIAYKDVTEAAREVMHDLVDRMESVSEPPASIQEKLFGKAGGK